MSTSLADIHPHIVQTHILPRLDGPSLLSTATASSYLQTLCTDDNLWSHICRSTWPSTIDPRLDHLISTFPAGHQSFFQDSFPALITDVNHYNTILPSTWSSSKPNSWSCSSHPCPSELISAIDICYQNDIIYSRVEFTDTTHDFLWSPFWVELKDDPPINRLIPGISRWIDLKVDELLGANKATLSHLKESLTLSWILIDPTRKRAVNLSSMRPVSVMQHWMTNDSLLEYVTVLPGCSLNDMVQCRIEVALGVGGGGVGLYVKEVVLKFEDLHCSCLNGRELFVILERVIWEESNVRRKVVEDDEERWRSYRKFKEMKIEKMAWVKKEEEKRELAVRVNCIGMLVFVYVFCLLFNYIKHTQR
ncbi:F-box protein At2g27310 [Lactuca sativa]|uniref:F-box protein At2g27310 n=1 Tax=Lactuca sativa TaxID=4236 RepID=UPI000CAC2431|nr:F-box protein At2g27310 [Lactuca sativa]